MRVAVLGPAHLEPLFPRLDMTAEEEAAIPRRTIGTPVAPLAAALLDRGHDVLLATLDTAVTDELVMDGDRLRVRIGHYRPRHRARDAFAFERGYLQRILQSERCDVVHAHWSYEYALAAMRAPVPAVVTLRDWAPTVLRMHPHPYRVVRLLMNLRVLYGAQQLTVTSPYMQTKVERWLRRPVPLIPNGLPDNSFNQRTTPACLDAPTLLAVNNGFQTRKNVTALLRAFPTVLAWNPHATLQLVGHGYGPDGEAKRWAEASGLAESVVFSGVLQHEDAVAAMRRADVLVHPAREESFGMVLAEAMAQGLPVIGGHDSGAVPWVLAGGNAGILTNIRSPAAIARSIIELLSDADRWRHFSVSGFRRAREAFRLSAVVDQYEAIYTRTTAGRTA